MNINKFIYFSLIQLFSISSFGQLSQAQLDTLVNRYTRQLINTGIDTICIYNEYCLGCNFQPVNGTNLCAENFSSLPTYIFWKDKGETFVTRKDICFEYSTQAISGDSIWSFYHSKKDKIKKEELKLPQYIELENGKKTIQSINVEHSIYFQITWITGKESLTKVINSAYLIKELGPHEELNINYEYNSITSLNKFHAILQRIIKQESIKKKFIKTLR